MAITICYHLSLVLWPASHSLRTLTTALVCSSSCLACHRKVPTENAATVAKIAKRQSAWIQIIPDPFWKQNVVFQRITVNPHWFSICETMCLVKRLHWRRLSWHPWELGCRFLTSLSSSSSSSSVTTGFGVIPNRSHARWKLVKTTCENSDENLRKPNCIYLWYVNIMSIMSHNEKIFVHIAAAGSGIPSIIRFFSVAASGLMWNWEIPVPSCRILRLLLLALIGGKNSWLILFD